MVAVLACIAILVGPNIPRTHVARLTIDGVISDTSRQVLALDAMAKDSSARALMVRINSPGGGVYAAEQLHDAIERVAAVKPVAGGNP